MLPLIFVVVIILVPSLLMVISWFHVLQKQYTQSQIKINKVYSCLAATAEFTRMMSKLPMVDGLTTNWISGTEETYSIWVDTDTAVTVTLTHEGYN
jgi:hypothetical protein